MALGAYSISSSPTPSTSIRSTWVVPIGHPFVPGNAVALNGRGLVLAKGANAIGIVESVSHETAVVVYQGEVDLMNANLSLVLDSGKDFLEVGECYGASGLKAGALGCVFAIRPILIATSPKGGVVINSLQGRQAESESRITYPAGAVMAWAGSASRIPSQWRLCDGQAVRKAGANPSDGIDYAALYSAIGDRYKATAMAVSVEGRDQSCLIVSFAQQGHDERTTDPCQGLLDASLRDRHKDYKIGWGGSEDYAIGQLSFGDLKDSTIHFTFRQSYPKASARTDWTGISGGIPITIQSLGDDEVPEFRSERFFIPDMRARTVFGAGYSVGLSQQTRGDIGGEQTHLLTADEMPHHTNKVFVSESETEGMNEVLAVKADIVSTSEFGFVETPFSEGNRPLSLLPPYLSMNWIICHSSPHDIGELGYPPPCSAQGTSTAEPQVQTGIFRHEANKVMLNGLVIPLSLFRVLEPSYQQPSDIVAMSYDGIRRHYRTLHKSWTIHGSWLEGDRYLSRADEFSSLLSQDQKETTEAFREVRNAKALPVKDKYPTEGNNNVKLHERDDLNKGRTEGVRPTGKRASRNRGKHSGGATGGSPQ